MTAAFFNSFQLGALAALLGLGIGRAAVLYARGVHVLAVDRQRSPAQGLADLLALILLFWWAYEALAFSWPGSNHALGGFVGKVLVDSAPTRVIGGIIVLAGLVIFTLALWAFADSWRIGIDRNTPGALVTSGIFGWSRNPIYSALDLIFWGTFLLQGRTIFLLLALALTALLHYQVRREERHLAAAYGPAYREYCARVGRYLTWR